MSLNRQFSGSSFLQPVKKLGLTPFFVDLRRPNYYVQKTERKVEGGSPAIDIDPLHVCHWRKHNRLGCQKSNERDSTPTGLVVGDPLHFTSYFTLAHHGIVD